jgi:hypothetical protein
MGREREDHDDGSHTDRYPDTGQSVTYDRDGHIIESSKPETSWPVPEGFGPLDVQVTRDDKGNVINRQSRK